MVRSLQGRDRPWTSTRASFLPGSVTTDTSLPRCPAPTGALATRSPSFRPTSTPPPLGCSTSSASSMPAAAGTWSFRAAWLLGSASPRRRPRALRVARALDVLPLLAIALARASVVLEVRELTRVRLRNEARCSAWPVLHDGLRSADRPASWRQVDGSRGAGGGPQQRVAPARVSDRTATVRIKAATAEVGALLVQALSAAREALPAGTETGPDPDPRRWSSSRPTPALLAETASTGPRP